MNGLLQKSERWGTFLGTEAEEARISETTVLYTCHFNIRFETQ
jgi:hypothetical protein